MKTYFLYYFPLTLLASITTAMVLPTGLHLFAVAVISYNVPLQEILGEVFDIRYSTEEIDAIVDGE